MGSSVSIASPGRVVQVLDLRPEQGKAVVAAPARPRLLGHQSPARIGIHTASFPGSGLGVWTGMTPPAPESQFTDSGVWDLPPFGIMGVNSSFHA